MNCGDIQEELIEAGRGRELSSDVRKLVFAHAAQCKACGATLERERKLTRALNDVAMASAQAPHAIQAEIRRQVCAPGKRRRHTIATWAAWGAVAAGLIVGGWTVERSGFMKPAAVPAARQAVQIAPERPSAADSMADDEGFIPLPYVDAVSENEPADIVRVAMPRESLLAMGVPVNPDAFGEQIQADILVGLDGTARAIRIAE